MKEEEKDNKVVALVKVDESKKKEEKSLIQRLNVLSGQNLVKPEDLVFIESHKPLYEKRLRTRSYFRSPFEMEASVLNDDTHPTPDSKYWQAIGEQIVQLQELITLSYEVAKSNQDRIILETEIEEMKIQLSQGTDKLACKKAKAELRKKEIELEQIKFGSIMQAKTAKERMSEIRDWEKIIQELHGQLEYGDEDFRLHHAKRYFFRYKRKIDRLEHLAPEERENALSHFLSMSNHPDNKELLKTLNLPGAKNLKVLTDGTKEKTLLPPELSAEVDYSSPEEAMSREPIVGKFYDRNVTKILVVSPHREKGQPCATNLNTLQMPAGCTSFIEEPFGLTVADARNYAVHKAKEEGFHFVFFVDDDLIIPIHTVVQLYKHRAPVVGGMYYRKYFPLETCGMYEIDGRPASLDNYKIGEIIHNTLVLPSGCTLFNVEDTFNKLEQPWYKTITIQGRCAVTEDTYICERLRGLDIDILTDTGIQCVHVDRERGLFYAHEEVVQQNKVKEELAPFYAWGN